MITQFLKKSQFRRRSSHLAIVVLPDEATAFQAYRLLQYHGISPENLAIVGEGYSSPDRVGLVKPSQIVFRRARSLSISSSLFGTALAIAIPLLWKIEANLLTIVAATAIVSAVCGAIVGAVLGFLGEGSTMGIYRHHLDQGRYLLMMEGSETLVRWGQEVLGYYSAPSLH